MKTTQKGRRVAWGYISPSAAVALVLLTWFLLLTIQPANAQTVTMPTIEQVMQDGRTLAGLAETIMEGLLGGVFHSPFSLGGPTTLFGVIFFAFNAFVFAAAVAWGTYGSIAGIVQTAHEGQVLGKRLNAVWVPIRTVSGIGSLVPIFGGFSLSQAVMVLALGWGIVGANYVTAIGINAISNFAPMTAQSAIKGTPTASARDLSFNLFMQRLCMHGHELHINQSRNPIPGQLGGGVEPPESAFLQNNSQRFLALATESGVRAREGVGSVFGTIEDPTACLSVGLIRNRYVAPGVHEGGMLFGRQFRNYSVEYEQIAAQAYERYTRAFAVLQRDAWALADEYVRQYDAFLRSGAAAETPAIPAASLLRIASNFAAMDTGEGARALEMQRSEQAGAIREGVLQQVQGLGFLSLGMYHSMISEANTALNAAQNAVIYHISGSNALFAADSQVTQSHYIAAALRSAQRMGFSGVGTASAQNLNDLLNFDMPSDADSWLGSNLGQKILNVALGVAVTGNERAGINNFSLIDPIISAKNIGDYLMTGGSTLLAMSATQQLGARVAASGASTVGRVMSVIPGLQAKGGSMAVIGDAASAVMAHAKTIGWVMLLLGIVLAIYIPFVPFLNWVSAMVQYVATVVQAFVAAPLWALAHMDINGEGMGQRTERGYVWILFVMFKPVLMVIAFFAATGMVILIGSVVTWIYLPVVANVQGNSVTGMFSIIGFIFLYFVLLNVIIQGSFNLVQEISDDAIGWIGGVNKSSVGRDMDSRTAAVFINATRSSRGELATRTQSSGNDRQDRRQRGGDVSSAAIRGAQNIR